MKNAFRLAVAIAAASAVPTFAQNIPPSVEFRVPKPPTVAAGDGGAFLAYELHITNLTAAALTLRTVEVRGSDGATLLTLADSALLPILLRPGPTIPLAERRQIAGGTRAHLYVWVPVNRDAPPPTLSHRLTFGRAAPDTTLVTIDGAVTRVEAAPVKVGAPLRGEWLAANGPSNLSGHRRTAMGLQGTVAIAQRFGIDFLQVDENGRTFKAGADSTDNKSYFAYGKEIHAVGDGRVVFTKDSIPENSPRSPIARAVPIDLVTVAGNHIVVDMGGGRFAFYAHIQPGTLRVRLGDRVRRGQVLGLVGNSGNSTEPHLHFHIVDGLAAGTSTLGAEGIPYALPSFELLGRCEITRVGIQCTRASPIPVKEAMPLQNQLVRFPQ